MDTSSESQQIGAGSKESHGAARLNVVAGLLAIGLTAAAVYLLDPQTGKRRRALLRDRLHSQTHRTQEFLGKASRDARERVQGLYAGSRSRLQRGRPADEVLVERVRARLGRLSSHPGAIEVGCSEGIVRLTGDILGAEVGPVVRGAESVRGVRQVLNEMRSHSEAGNIPALQGDSTRRLSPQFEYLQQNWSPAPRLLAGFAGASMIIGGSASRSIPGAAIAVAGGVLLARSLCNRPLSHVLGLKARAEDGILVQKTIHVYAEPDEVYSRWRDLERFPEFMSHVRQVRKTEGNRYRWTVDGPGGIPVEWDAEITADVPQELIAWRTLEGAPVQSVGVVQFESSSYGGTRVHVRMTYRPPANAVGHGIAKVFGKDPKRQMDTDLARFKSVMESGAAYAYTSESRH